MKRFKRILWGAGIALALLVVLPYLLPLDYFIPVIARFASEQIRAPVQIDSLRLIVLPRPHLAVRGIVVGKHPFLEVREVLITPRLSSLFSTPRVIDEITLRDVVVGQALVAKASVWASRAGGKGPTAVRVARVEVRDAFANLAEFKMRNLDVDVEFAGDGALDRAQVRADNGRFDATLLPRGRDLSVHIVARDWKLPAGPPLLMSELVASGTLIPLKGVTLETIDGRLYGGSVIGRLSMGWAGEWTLDGALAIIDVEIQPIVALLTKDTTISGRLSANPIVAMRAPSAAQLAEAVDVESDFKVEQGILYKLDLGNAPQALLKKSPINRGQTRFDKFTGHLGVDAAGYYLTNVEIASGVLTAEAEVSISAQQELAGNIDVALKGTSGILSTPLVVTGTVQSPVLYPSKAALAGAAAGTMLLGPVLGTTVGMKAGRYTQKLFGAKRVKKAKPPTAGNKAPAAPPPGSANRAVPAVSGGR